MRTGSKVKRAREQAGLTQLELAERSKLALRTMTNIEQGQTGKPKLVDIAAIAAVLGGTCADFLPDDEPEPDAAGRGRPPLPSTGGEDVTPTAP